MATIRKRGRRYQVQIRRKGYSPVSRSFLLKSDASEWARYIETQADRQELAPSRKILERLTLGDLVTRYRDCVVPTLRAADKETYIVNAFLRHAICKKTMAELSTKDFAKYRDERLQTITGKSLRRMLSPINHMFRIACDEWNIPLKENPLAKLRIKVVDDKRQRRLREGELTTLLRYCASGLLEGANGRSNRLRNPYLPVIIQFALETAMRRSEMLSLQWGQIDIQRQTAMILGTKNGYSRTIPLSPGSVDLIEQAKTLAFANDRTKKLTDVEVRAVTTSLVFPVKVNAFNLAWHRLLKRTGIDDLHFHDLRHEAISRLFELGLTVPEVASISGHRDLRMLMRYAHADQSLVRQKLGINM